MLERKRNVTRRELRVFGALWLLLFVALGLAAAFRPRGLVVGAALSALAWAVSMILNPAPRKLQSLGLAIPAVLALTAGAVRAGAPAWATAVATASAGLAGAVLIWASPAFGRRLFFGWMDAALPLGWTISHVVLAAVYYLVVTPVGLALRLAGRDAMQRKLDRTARSYWIERGPATDRNRAFKQF